MKAPALVFALPIALAAACGGDDTDPGQPDGGTDQPDADEQGACSVDDWSAPNFDDNAADALALRDQLAALKGAMEDAEVSGDEVDRGALDALYGEDGDPSLAEVASDNYDAIIAKTLNDFVKLVAKQDPEDTPLTDTNGDWTGGQDGEGGIYFGRGLDGAGMEPVQLVEKGLFGAAQYNKALSMTVDDITPATIDAFAALWGTDADLTPDVTDLAHYAYGMGFHAETAEALTAAKSYAQGIADGEDCGADLDDAVESFFRTWELAIVARGVYYVNSGRTAIQDHNSSEELANGLHGLAEGIGLLLGLYGVENPSSGPLSGAGRVMTDDDIESIMDALGFDPTTGDDTLNDSTTAEIFVNDNTTGDDAQAAIEDVVKARFGLSDADIENYYDPTAG